MNAKRFIGIACILGTIMAMTSMAAAIASSQPNVVSRSLNPVYQVNSSGQTFGNADAAANIEDEPNLIEVVATNGKEGYVLKEQLDEITLYSVSEEEADAARARNLQKAAAIMKNKLNERLTTSEAISTDEAKAAIQLIEADLTYLNPPAPQKVLFSETDSDLTALDTIPKSELVEIWQAVDEEMTVTIPVYESDGQTIIGEFPISLM